MFVAFDAAHGKGSHGRLYFGERFTTLKDRSKEIGPGLLKAMLEQLGLTRDDIVENITLYWLTNTAISSARLYWESKLAFFAPKNVPIPTAVSVFPDEIYAAPRTWTQKAYPQLIYYNRLPVGGHFAAWEQPELFSAELRAAFRPLR